MGLSIATRKRKDGTLAYRVRIRENNKTLVDITFWTQEQALKWVAEHGDEIMADPDKYIEWLLANRKSLKINRMFHKEIPIGHLGG